MCITAHAATETINWYMDGNTYATTQCETGSDIILPQTPYKYGYTFNGWFGYTPIEYLESTGTQWIDTGFAFTDILRQYPFAIDFTVAMETICNSNCVNYFSGVSNNNTERVITVSQVRWNTADTSVCLLVNNPSSTNCYKYTTNEKFHLKYTFDQSSNIYSVSGDATYGPTAIPNNGIMDVSDKHLLIGIPNGPKIPVRIYRWIYESNGVKIRDFIPVLDSNNVPCMFDKVEKKFYYNQGTGQFIAGPVIGGE